MSDSNGSHHWIGRIVGGIVVAAASYGLLLFWDTWDLSHETQLMVSGGLGLLFVVFGGSVWRWIDNIDLWS